MKIYPVFNYSQNVYPVGMKPAVVPVFGNKKLLTQPIIDSFSSKRTDKSLSPKFLKSLVEIYKKNISLLQKATIIKDEVLKAMGYKHPEILKIVPAEPEQFCSSYEATQGVLCFSEDVPSIEIFIASLRHEVEHMDQFVKIYKTKGEKAMLNAFLNIAKLNNMDCPKSIIINNAFYDIMSKDVSAEGFDSEKYYKAMSKYVNFDFARPSKKFKYHNNLLEKDAYNVERKVLKALGKDPITTADYFPKNYKTLLKLMNKNGIPSKYHDNVLLVLDITARLKSIECPENVKRYLKIWVDKNNHNYVSPEDIDWFKKIAEKINKTGKVDGTLQSVQKNQEYYQQMEKGLREGTFCVTQILENM